MITLTVPQHPLYFPAPPENTRRNEKKPPVTFLQSLFPAKHTDSLNTINMNKRLFLPRFPNNQRFLAPDRRNGRPSRYIILPKMLHHQSGHILGKANRFRFSVKLNGNVNAQFMQFVINIKGRANNAVEVRKYFSTSSLKFWNVRHIVAMAWFFALSDGKRTYFSFNSFQSLSLELPFPTVA